MKHRTAEALRRLMDDAAASDGERQNAADLLARAEASGAMEPPPPPQTRNAAPAPEPSWDGNTVWVRWRFNGSAGTATSSWGDWTVST